ncbi:MAG: hypothetical protein HYX32_02705 [Actinobacteria bacterium]|nr:hypothetical protein [Actinomycetota bacterium]
MRARRPGRHPLFLPATTVAAIVGLVAAACTVPPPPPPPPPGEIFPGTNCAITPTSAFWRADVSGLPVHPNSANWIANSGQTAGSGGSRSLKADFGSGLWNGEKIGIPYNVADSSTPRYNLTFDIADESDQVPYPIPGNPNIEGGGDRHILTVEKDTCRLYETWDTRLNNGQWEAGSGATWSMTSNAMRPDTWTSADAAGLQILPGLVRWEEWNSGVIPHAIRITIPHTQRAYDWPASHQAGDTTSSNTPKMGAWMRLKSTVNPDNYDPYLRPIIVALKTYGAVVADNGSPFYMSGAPDERWDNEKLQLLSAIRGSDFEYVNTTSLKVANNSYQATTAS